MHEHSEIRVVVTVVSFRVWIEYHADRLVELAATNASR